MCKRPAVSTRTRSAWQPGAKILMLNLPCNPTGGTCSVEQLEKIAAFCREKDLLVLSDEIYSRLAYQGEFFSIAQVPGMYERTIISDGASKTWAMTGWRIGFTSNPVLAPVFTRWITNTESCASQISQWAAVEALSHAIHAECGPPAVLVTCAALIPWAWSAAGSRITRMLRSTPPSRLTAAQVSFRRDDPRSA